jgi:hypothetical protein
MPGLNAGSTRPIDPQWADPRRISVTFEVIMVTT